MRKKTTGLLFILLIVSGTMPWFGRKAFSHTSGSPDGNTGSPGDGQTCAHVGCHTGTAAFRDSLVISDIPETGYLSTDTYDITVQIVEPEKVKFGFQASPQDTSGNLLGAMWVTDPIQMKVTGLGKYITHKSTGTMGSGGKTWTFRWNSGAATGDVTFYAAVNASNDDGHASGDKIYYSFLTVHEDSSNIPASAGWETLGGISLENPVHDLLTLHCPADGDHRLHCTLFDMEGRMRLDRVYYPSSGILWIDMQGFGSGLYLLRIESEGFSTTLKCIKL